MALKPCPEIQAGSGHVVLSTFAHPATHEILDVTIGEGEDVETIGVTETHPFWSVQDQAFVPVGHLVAGSQVLTADEQTKTITSILPRPGPAQQVYNLEVNGEHVYYVGQQQLLVHNNYTYSNVNEHGEGIIGFLEDGNLMFMIQNAKGTTRKSGHQLFGEMLESFGDKVKGIHGSWSNVHDATNINKNLGRLNVQIFENGASLEQAVWKTWTGRQALENGFSQFKVLDFKISPVTGDFINLEVFFFK